MCRGVDESVHTLEGFLALKPFMFEDVNARGTQVASGRIT